MANALEMAKEEVKKRKEEKKDKKRKKQVILRLRYNNLYKFKHK